MNFVNEENRQQFFAHFYQQTLSQNEVKNPKKRNKKTLVTLKTKICVFWPEFD